MKVYVIESGCYSDSHIVCVKETEDEAKEVINILSKARNSDNLRYTEYDTNQFNLKRIKFLVIYMFEEWYVEYDSYDSYVDVKENSEIYEDAYIVYSDSVDKAIKIAQDMRSYIKASKENII